MGLDSHWGPWTSMVQDYYHSLFYIVVILWGSLPWAITSSIGSWDWPYHRPWKVYPLVSCYSYRWSTDDLPIANCCYGFRSYVKLPEGIYLHNTPKLSNLRRLPARWMTGPHLCSINHCQWIPTVGGLTAKGPIADSCDLLLDQLI